MVTDKNTQFCERLKALGYAHHNRVRIYGEEFDLTSNPMADEDGFSIEAISRKSGRARKLHIPLSILYMIGKDMDRALVKAA
jgi:hypothetical protein